MKKILLILLSVIPLHISAQTISGHVYKAEDNTPVQFGNVVLHTLPDSAFVTGVVTYMGGEFSIEKVKPGNYFLKISYVGYKPNFLDVIVTEGDTTIELGNISLIEKTEEIESVQVTGKMLRGKELVDRTVYQVPPDIEKSSTTGYDVLKKIPSVQVDFNNNISINGKRNFIIQVDGKQRDPEFLNRIMPGDIESIEVIDNPSGRYDGTVDAVLNIKLKPEARTGISGNIGVMGKPFGKPTVAANGGIDYGFEKITFYVSGFSFQQNLDNFSNVQNKFLFLDPDSINTQQGNGGFKIGASSLNTGFDYYINKKNNLSINYNYRPTNNKITLDYDGLIYLGNALTNENSSETKTNSESDESNISLFYKHEFDKPIQELTSENNFYFFKSVDDNMFLNELYDLEHTTLYSNIRDEYSNSKRNYASSKWNYVHPLGMSIRIESGIQLYYQTMKYDFTASDTSFNNGYRYNELRNAAYSGITYNKKKIGVQVNLRLERSDIEIEESSSNGYFTLLPSMNLQYKISSSHNVKLTYNRRINRPNIYNLNPNIRYTSNNTFTRGNPELKPELRDRLQLTYTTNFGKSFVSPQIYYEFLSDKTSTRNLIENSPITGTPAIVSQPENMLTGYETGVGINGFVKFVYLDARIYKGHFNKFDDDITHIDSRDYYSYSITNFLTAPLFEEKLNTFAFLNYSGVTVDAQSKTYNPFIYGLGANVKIKKVHTLGLVYVLPFNKELEFSRTVTSTEQLYNEVSNNFKTEYFIQLQYHYSFNKGKAVKKLDKNIHIESDTKMEGLQQ